MYRTLERMSQMLTTFHKILEKAEAHLGEQMMDPNTLLQASLYEDMHGFIRQIQMSTDTLKFATGRLADKADEIPSFPDTEESFEELHARLDKAIDYFKTFSPEDFEGAEERHITLPFAKDMYAIGEDYLHGFVVPNFYFHVTTAYDILWSQGVAIGKRDYIGAMPLRPIE